jgi:methylase of polypeptide subunit release factors
MKRGGFDAVIGNPPYVSGCVGFFRKRGLSLG